jgi:hypothetical protein
MEKWNLLLIRVLAESEANILLISGEAEERTCCPNG